MSVHHGSIPKLDSRIKSDIESTIRSAKIFMLSKVKCGACIQAKALLNKLASKTGSIPVVFECDNYPRRMVKAIVKWLSAKTGIKTVPQIWIHGKFVGGNDDVQRLHGEGRLVSMITKKPTSTRGKVLEGRSFWTDNAAPMFSVSLPNLDIPRQSHIKDYRSDSLNSSKTIKASRSPLSYRSSTYTIDDNKQDMALLTSQFQNLILEKPKTEKSFSYAGYNMMGSPNISSTNRVLLSSGISGSLTPKPTNVGAGNTSIAGARNVQWATVQHRGRSRTKEGPKGVLISRFV